MPIKTQAISFLCPETPLTSVGADSKVQLELKCPAIHFRNAPLRRHKSMRMTKVLSNELLLMQNKTNYDNHHVNKIRNPCGFVM